MTTAAPPSFHGPARRIYGSHKKTNTHKKTSGLRVYKQHEKGQKGLNKEVRERYVHSVLQMWRRLQLLIPTEGAICRILLPLPCHF